MLHQSQVDRLDRCGCLGQLVCRGRSWTCCVKECQREYTVNLDVCQEGSVGVLFVARRACRQVIVTRHSTTVFVVAVTVLGLVVAGHQLVLVGEKERQVTAGAAGRGDSVVEGVTKLVWRWSGQKAFLYAVFHTR